ncbi:MAG: DinB family protein [Chloroflexota bacterium]|nr:DinB family protein [Chloroflexota bacterium]
MDTSQDAQTTSTNDLALDMLRTLFDYSVWARDRLLEVIEPLEESRLRELPGDGKGVYGTIFDTLAHMAASEWLWTQRVLGESPMRSPRGEEFNSLRNLVDWWNGVHADSVRLLNDLSPADLETELTYVGPDGKRRTRKTWHMLLQVPNHQTEHRSQLATMLGNLGVEVPQTDLVVYLSEQAGR